MTDNTNTYQSMFQSIQDAQSLLCLDAGIVYQGAQFQLSTCNSIAPTQSLYMAWSNVDPNQPTFQWYINASTPLCATLVPGSLLTLQPCVGDPTQTFLVNDMTLDGGYVLKAQTGDCLGTVSKNVFTYAGATDCDNYPEMMLGGNVPTPYVRVPANIQQIKINGLCLDGASILSISIVACTNSASQLWFHSFGQIRNVALGLCLDSPGASAATATQLSSPKLSTCRAASSQSWLINVDGTIRNAANFNCLHFLAAPLYKLYLGNNYCGSSDSYKNFPKVFNHSLVLQPPVGPCMREVVRKDYRDLTPNEQSAYLRGLNILKAMPSFNNFGNRYNDFVGAHASAGSWYHSTPMFLPWHRAFLRFFELELQLALGNSSFGLPYWAWGADTDEWWDPAVGILNSTAFGTVSNTTDPNLCITDGIVANWTSSQGSCIRRYYDTTGFNENAIFDEATMLGLIQVNPYTQKPYTSFNDWSVYVGIPHGIFHMAISGSSPNGDYGNIGMISNSPDDPVFFLHHGNLDRYWKYWQRYNPKISLSYDGKQYYPPGIKTQTPVSVSDTLITFNFPVKRALEYDSGMMCFTEQPYSLSLDSIQVAYGALSKRSRRSLKETKAQKQQASKAAAQVSAKMQASKAAAQALTKKQTSKEAAQISMKKQASAKQTTVSNTSKISANQNNKNSNSQKNSNSNTNKNTSSSNKNTSSSGKNTSNGNSSTSSSTSKGKPHIPGSSSSSKAKNRKCKPPKTLIQLVERASANMLMDHKVAKVREATIGGFRQDLNGKVDKHLKTLHDTTIDAATMGQQADALAAAILDYHGSS